MIFLIINLLNNNFILSSFIFDNNINNKNNLINDENNDIFTSIYKFDDNLNKIRDKLQYAIIIDAGSSGSRVFIYVWPPHSGDMRQLLKIRLLRNELGRDLYYAIQPGLSTCCSKNTSLSIEYIKPLLDFASKHIPIIKHNETPLYIMATAGMRLLDNNIQNKIIDNLREEIPKRYKFLFTNNNIVVISGKEEGLYSWIALNYMIGRFDYSHNNGSIITIENNDKQLMRMNTVQMIEMGGASIQIAFEITNNEHYNNLKKKFPDKIFEINLGCNEHDINHQYRLFISTFLSLGANSIRKNYVNQLIKQSINDNNLKYLNNSHLLTKETILFDPCLSIDSSETINITADDSSRLFSSSSSLSSSSSSSLATQYLFHLKGSGEFEQCVEKLNKIINIDGVKWCDNDNNNICPYKELKNISIPFFDKNFYGLSEFWYTMNDIFHIGGKYDSNEFKKLSKKYCSTSWLVTQDRFKRKLFPNTDFKRLLYQCFKSSWIYSILHSGFNMPLDYQKFSSISKINDEPVQWTLGALIYRTRFFPLRTLDQQHGVMSEHVVNSHESTNIYVQYLLFALCMSAVIFFIFIYLCRLQLMLNNNNNQMGKYSYPSNNIEETFPLYSNNNNNNDKFYRKQQQQKEIFIDFG